MESAISEITRNGYSQPLLLKCSGQFHIKTDHSAINLTDCSCFAEAVEILLMCFFFNVEYPNELHLFYAFIEHLLGIQKSVCKSSSLSSFIRSLSGAAGH